jgi:hypothetical protein
MVTGLTEIAVLVGSKKGKRPDLDQNKQPQKVTKHVQAKTRNLLNIERIRSKLSQSADLDALSANRLFRHKPFS